MLTVKITGPLQAALVEVDDPQPKDDVVVVKIHSAPMCTEFHAFQAGSGSELGHEAAGEVVAVDRATCVQVGDRVVVQPQDRCGKCDLCETGYYIHCEHGRDLLAFTGSVAGRGTYGQYVLKADALLTPIPEGMSYDQAAMACCGLGPTFGAMQLLRVDAFDTVLITGLGPVGLGGVINARYRGARVIGVESHPYRAALAQELGAEAIINPADPDAVEQVRAITGGRGADKAVETSGAAAAKPFLVEAVRRRGQMAFNGWEGQVDAGKIIQKGLTIFGAWHYNLCDAGRLMQVVAASTAQLDQLITHRFPMSQVADAWNLQLSGNCGKVILHPWE